MVSNVDIDEIIRQAMEQHNKDQEEWWVYRNMPAKKRTVVHNCACGSCNHGKGKAGGTLPENGEWHGPYASKVQAEAEGVRIARRWGLEASVCSFCCK